MSRACRKADAVSCGAITRRLSERLQIADSRGGVTRMHGLGRRAEREESWGSRGDTVSGWPRIKNKHKNVTIWFTLQLCAIVSTLMIRGKFLNVPRRDGIPWVLDASQPWGWGVRHPPPLCVRTYIHVHLWMCLHIHAHNTQVCAYTCTHGCLCVHVHVHMCVCLGWKCKGPIRKAEHGVVSQAFRNRGTNTPSTTLYLRFRTRVFQTQNSVRFWKDSNYKYHMLIDTSSRILATA